jgi:hypothetical protein
MGQPMPPPMPLDDKTKEMLDKPTWEDVIGLLKNDLLRGFRVDIQTDSTIKADQDQERDARIQFLQSVGAFMQQAMQMQSPEMMPLLMAMMKFGIGGFKVGKELEGAFDQAAKNMAKPKGPPPPSEKELEIKSKETMQHDKLQADLAVQSMKSQTDLHVAEIQSQSRGVNAEQQNF